MTEYSYYFITLLLLLAESFHEQNTLLYPGGFLRIGTPSDAASKELLSCSVSAYFEEHYDASRVAELRREAGDAALTAFKKKRLWKSAETLQRGIECSIANHACVVATTLLGCGHSLLSGAAFGHEEQFFDVIIFDEACQSTLPAALVAMQRLRSDADGDGGGPAQSTLVMGGDHRQLPATVLSPAAVRGGLARSLFERFVEDGAR